MAKSSPVALTANQSAIYKVIKQYGPLPDHALVPLAQHAAGYQSSSGIRTRRNELVAKGLVVPSSTVKMPSGRHATIYSAV